VALLGTRMRPLLNSLALGSMSCVLLGKDTLLDSMTRGAQDLGPGAQTLITRDSVAELPDGGALFPRSMRTNLQMDCPNIPILPPPSRQHRRSKDMLRTTPLSWAIPHPLWVFTSSDYQIVDQVRIMNGRYLPLLPRGSSCLCTRLPISFNTPERSTRLIRRDQSRTVNPDSLGLHLRGMSNRAAPPRPLFLSGRFFVGWAGLDVLIHLPIQGATRGQPSSGRLVGR